MYGREGHDWRWGTWLWMGLMMTLLVVLVVAVVVLVVRATTGPPWSTGLPPGTTKDPSKDSETPRPGHL